jgi:hypothetical protein
MLTGVGHNGTVNRNRALWTVAALLSLNAVLLVAQPGLALPRSLTSLLFGPSMIRAEVVTKVDGAVHVYRVDRGRIRSVGVDTIIVRERDDTLVPIPIASDAVVTGVPRGQARRGSLFGLRKGMFVETLREGDNPAERVFVRKR